MTFYFSSISSGTFWSVIHTSIYKNSDLKVFKNIEFSGEISNNWPTDLHWTNVYETLGFNYYWQYYNGLILLQ